MRNNKFPIFNSGEILDKEMLELLRDNPMDLLSLQYEFYSDGIINGMNISVEEKNIKISKGIVKYNNILYKNKKECLIGIPLKEGKFCIKIKFYDKEINNKIINNKIEFIIGEDIKLEKNEIFLGKFHKQEGTFLRIPENSFDDFGISYNMINIIEQKKSCTHLDGTMPIEILETFGFELMKKKDLEGNDINFALMSINNTLKRKTILSYISFKKNLEYKDYTNQEIYVHLKEILDNYNSYKINKERRIPRINRMLVD